MRIHARQHRRCIFGLRQGKTPAKFYRYSHSCLAHIRRFGDTRRTLLCGCDDNFGGQPCQHFLRRHIGRDEDRFLFGVIADFCALLEREHHRRQEFHFVDNFLHLFRLDCRGRIRFVAVGHGDIENGTHIIIAVDAHNLGDAFCALVYPPPKLIPVFGGKHDSRLRQGLQYKRCIAGCDMAAEPSSAVQIIGKALAVLHNFL